MSLFNCEIFLQVPDICLIQGISANFALVAVDLIMCVLILLTLEVCVVSVARV